MNSKARLALCATAGQDPDPRDTIAPAVSETSLLAALQETRQALATFDPAGVGDALSASVETLQRLLGESADVVRIGFERGYESGRRSVLDNVEEAAHLIAEHCRVSLIGDQADARPVLRLVKGGGAA